MSAVPSVALVPYLGSGDEGVAAWARLAPGERRSTAMQAARDHDGATLWSLTAAWLRTFGPAGATVAPGTVRSYRCGVHALLVAWTGQGLLHADPDAATTYIRLVERRGLAPSPIQARVAAGRGLYAALRWCRALAVNPFAECRVPHDQTPAWDKRMPYGDDEVAALLQVARDPLDAVLVVLGAHAGLRAQECAALRWTDVHLARRDLVVRRGKGGKQRVVVLSATLRHAWQAEWRADGYVLPYRPAGSAWRHMQALCQAAVVMPNGVHALRHSAGTCVDVETRDLKATARHLGHSKLETTRIYVKWSDRQLRQIIGRW